MTKRSMMPGLLLIGLGIWLLRPHVLSDSIWERCYPFLILGGAVVMGIERVESHRDTLFGTVFLSCIGLFYLLRNFDLIPYLYLREYWPLSLSFIGLSSMVTVFLVPSHLDSLMPSILLLFLGLFLFSHTASDFLGGFQLPFSLIGALLLIAIGLRLVLGAFLPRK